MYLDFFRLREAPFDLTPNPKYLWLSARHQEALSNLEYGLFAAKPITLLVGDAGTGKTTLVRAALESARCRHVRCIYLNNPVLSRAEFIHVLARRIGLSPDAADSKAVFLEELERSLTERRLGGEVMALVIDEAQSLSYELLEEIRLLANVETATDTLLPMILSGQPELAARLNESRLRHLKQRITLRCAILSFTLEETIAYIDARSTIAGARSTDLFARDAARLIHERTGGNPRTINVICDNALLTAFGRGRRCVDVEIVDEVSSDFDLAPASAHPCLE
jgi:type II secretory pathway predicted ATPase ExeA